MGVKNVSVRVGFRNLDLEKKKLELRNILCLPLQPPTGTDTMVKAGVSTNISTKHQCITAMKEYESKSLEVSKMKYKK